MSTNGILTAEEFIRAAMQELGLLAAGENPTAEDVRDYLRSLSWMLKGWASRGLTSWLQQDVTAVVAAGQVSVDLPQSIGDVAGVRIGTVSSRPLFRIERGRYLELPNKVQQGIPTLYSPHNGVSGTTLYLWPVPRVDTTLYIDAVRVVEDVNEPDDVLDIPQRWTEAVYVALAARIANMSGATRLNPAGTGEIINRAQVLEAALFDADRPASIYMGV